MSTENKDKDKKAEETKEQPKKVKEVVKDAEVLKLLEED